MSQQKAKKQPFCQLLRRRNIDGAVWQNHDSNEAPFYVASVTRSYKDRNDKWQNDTLYVPLDDISRVVAILQEAEQRMYEQLQADYVARRNSAA